jgi:hypothetical protein
MAVLAVQGSQILAADDAATETEIRQVRKELDQVKAERKRVREDAAKDKKDFDEYTKRTQVRLTQVKSQTDSIRAQVKQAQRQNDSLGARLSALRAGKREYDLLQDRFRQQLIAGCDQFLHLADSMPPLASQSLISALSFLRSDLTAKNIDNPEGINRLLQIGRDLNDATGAIQISQGPSPLADLKGTVFRLRIGTVFEAMVDEKGTAAALWAGSDSAGAPRWTVSRDPAVTGPILKAVEIRDGKALPAFVELPFGSGEGGSR